MKIFVLGVPHTQTTPANPVCAFTTKAWNLCRMLTARNHRVIHFGVEGSDPECAENIPVVSRAEWEPLFAHEGGGKFHSRTDGAYGEYQAKYARNLRQALLSRLGKPWEAILCCTWGGAQIPATSDLKQFVIESGIGYRHTFARYRVFESYAWLHFHWGLEKRFEGNRWYDVVIPNSVDSALFDYRPEDKGKHFVFLGRLNSDKGAAIAIEATQRAGRKLLLVGPGSPAHFLEGNRHVEHLSAVGIEGRRKLLAEAAGLFCPTQYVEPFGNVAIEAQASGTPVISTDWGAFSETVLHGRTGYRCRTLEQFVWAARNIERIEPAMCRRWAVENFSIEKMASMYEEYFQMLFDLNHAGWYEHRDQRTELDWLAKAFP